MRAALYRRASMLVCVLLSAGMLVGLTSVRAVPDGQTQSITPLFIPAAQGARLGVPELPLLVGTQRTRIVQIDREVLTRWTGISTPASVHASVPAALNLFDDVRYTASALRLDQHGIGTASRVWFGTLDSVAYSSVVLLMTPTGEFDLRILTPGKSYTVQPLGGHFYRISEIDMAIQRGSQHGFDDAVLIQPDPVQAARVRDRVNSPRADSGDVIDVMVVYTPRAAAFFGGQHYMQIAIENTVALTNRTYENSAVQFRIRLVYSAQVDYVERPFLDLDRLANPSDGYLDEVHTLRDAYAADLVVLIPGTEAEDRGYCGIAFLPTSLPAPDAAFAVTEALCISDITFAHELGHTMGKAHDRANAGGAVHTYAYGYQDPADPPGADWGDFVTLMAYSDGGECPPVFQPGVCPAIAWWSNPNQTFNGKPIGSAGENNVLSLNQTAQLIANYRVSADGSPTATPTPGATATPVPGTDPTATPDSTRQWLLNGDFEIDADRDRIPDGWSAVRAKQKCRDLNCYVVLKGKHGKAKLKQVLMYDELVSGTLIASVRLTGKKLAAQGKVTVKVRYVDTEAQKLKLTFSLPPGTSPEVVLTQSGALSGRLQSLKVVAKYEGVSGKMMLDDVSIILSGTAPLP